MIIQCRKCETRFRFDETLIEGDGVWVRCSRCQHVFFQEKQAAEPLSAASAVGPEIPSVKISDAKHITDDHFSTAEEQPPRVEIERTEMPPPLAQAEREIHPEIEKEISLEGLEMGMVRKSLGGPVTPGEKEEEEEEEEEQEELIEVATGRRRWGRAILKLFALTLFIVIVSGVVSLWIFPEIRTQVLEWAYPWLRGVPAIEKLLGTELKGREAASSPVRIKDVRQRSVANLLVGNLHVIEGVAVNQSPYPLARITVRLVISDAYDVTLGEKISYCGNILTDAELGALAETEIQRELSTLQGTDVSNERIEPKGEIPFMFVFSQEQAGAVKTTVTPAGAERVS
ncbi:MAG: zinc-ribbon domain-containing protein [Proteobacteria bacterium]|nr:zinc-ribbon domain-containing protein [Pseudomonadota bacterium]MBU3931498.1 zinc-ribbon domain-containing protein [Pseudomonadota bacterium]MBU4073776.1 zinc-ribbon domain-containing protein [Pseudomonadota bacterium]